jgi:hypothetical protein
MLLSLDNLLKEMLDIAFQRDGLGQPSFKDFAEVGERLMSAAIDVTNDRMSPDKVKIVADCVEDYVDEKLAMEVV